MLMKSNKKVRKFRAVLVVLTILPFSPGPDQLQHAWMN